MTVLATLSGCTRPGDEHQRDPTGTGEVIASVPEPRSPKPLEFVGRRSALVQELSHPVRDLPPLRTVLPERISFDEIQQAPLLHEAPIRSAVLAVGTVPQAYAVGEVSVVSPSGEWRVVDELATGRATRIKVPAKDPVLHWWTPDGASVVVTPRGRTMRTLDVRVVERVVERLGFFAWSSSAGTVDRVAELVPNPRSADENGSAAGDAYTAVRHWRDDRGTSEIVELENAVPSDAQSGNQFSPSLVGIVQGACPEGRKLFRGVLAVDPATGRSVGLLSLTPGQVVWASVAGVLDDRWLLLDIASGPGGGLVAWDPVVAELRNVLPIDEQAANVSIAMRLVSESLR